MRSIEFVVLGTPVSQQTRRRHRVHAWRAEIQSEARRVASADHILWQADVVVELTYYFSTTPIDVDNLAKPVLDALKGTLVRDDRQVDTLVIRRKALERLGGRLTITGATPALRTGLASGGDFLHVVVRQIETGST